MEDTENETFLYSEFSLQHWMLLAFDHKTGSRPQLLRLLRAEQPATLFRPPLASFCCSPDEPTRPTTVLATSQLT